MEVWVPQFVVVIPSVLVSVIGLIFFGLAEKRYIGKGPIIANIFLLWQVLLPKTASLDKDMVLYLNLSIPFCLISVCAFLSTYIKQIKYQKLHDLFYQLAYGLYSSKTVLGIVVGSVLGVNLIGMVIISIIIWYLAINYLGHRPPFGVGA